MKFTTSSQHWAMSREYRLVAGNMPSRLLVLLAFAALVDGFDVRVAGMMLRPQQPRRGRHRAGASCSCHTLLPPVPPSRAGRTVARFSFFKDLLDRAFENDSNLSQTDRRKGQLEGPGEDDAYLETRPKELTETQQKWRQVNEPQQRGSAISIASSVASMDFYLTGVPNKDPSNDLFGSRVNISSRDRRVNQALPKVPTVPSVQVEFRDDQTCRCRSETPFTAANSEGEWKLSDGGGAGQRRQEVRFRIPVLGYTRIVETKGTIQKVYWSEGENAVRETSTTYAIEPGWLYGEASLSLDRRTGHVQWDNGGVLKVEKTGGLLGAATKLVPCGTFVVTKSTPVDAEEAAK